MSKVFNMVGGGGGKNISSIIITGLSSTDTVTCTKDGKSYPATWDETDQKWEIIGLPTGTYTVTSNRGTDTITETVLIDVSGVYEISMAFAHIYGVTWDGSSTTKWVRTDESEDFQDPSPALSGGTGSSPFDNIEPWSGMVRVTDDEAGELVAIPKFWYKLTKDGTAITLKIATKSVEGFSVSPAHMDRGDGKGERDVVYVGRYQSVSGYKSASGATPIRNISRSTARTNIHNLGETIWQWDIAMLRTIQMLYLVEYADWYSQTVIGYGCGNLGGNVYANTGLSDSMSYHTGTMQSARSSAGAGIQYRYIEDLWANAMCWIDGCYYNSNGFNVILNPSKFSNNQNGTPIGTFTNGYTSAINIPSKNGLSWMFYPSAASGSATTYVTDSATGEAQHGETIAVSGREIAEDDKGLFSIQTSGSDGSGASWMSTRVMKLP